MLNSLLNCDQDILVPNFDLTDTIQLELSIIANGFCSVGRQQSRLDRSSSVFTIRTSVVSQPHK